MTRFSFLCIRTDLTHRNGVFIFTLFLLLFFPAWSYSQPPSPIDTLIQREAQITEIDWRLISFNFSWVNFLGDEGYMKSSTAAIFDYKAKVFRTYIMLAEKRSYDDSEPFFGLPRVKQEALLKAPVDNFLKLLGSSFPEIPEIGKVVEIHFIFYDARGGATTAAIFSKGNWDFRKLAGY